MPRKFTSLPRPSSALRSSGWSAVTAVPVARTPQFDRGGASGKRACLARESSCPGFVMDRAETSICDREKSSRKIARNPVFVVDAR